MDRFYNFYNFGLDDRSNFWLSKVYQKYMQYEYRNLTGKMYNEPFVYFSQYENKLLLGSNNYRKKIDGFVKGGFVKERIIGNSKYNKPMYGYEPVIEPLSRIKRYEVYIDKYYKYLLTNLSYYGRIIANNLTHVNIDIFDEYFYMMVDKFIYPKYLKSKGKDAISYDKYLKRFEWVNKHIKMFNDSNFDEMINFIKEDIYGNRVHTIVSSLSKEFRKRIFLDNEDTIEIDLEQSQPNICSVLIRESIGDNSFSKVVEHGNLYLYIKDNLGFKSISDAKEFYFKSAYGYPSSSESIKLYKMFPDIENYIRYIKTSPMISNPNSSYYTNYAHIAQRKETEIFREVWKELNKYNILFVPVHDSIIVRSKQAEIVVNIMYEILKNKIHPNIKLKKH